MIGEKMANGGGWPHNWFNTRGLQLLPDRDGSHRPLDLHVRLALVDAHHLTRPLVKLLMNFTHQDTWQYQG